MVFNSISFLVFFALIFHLYWLVNKHGSTRQRNLFLLLSSYIFYGWWDWRFLALIALSSVADYLIGLKIHRSSGPRQRHTYLLASIIINLGILGFFKYFNFFITSLTLLFQQAGLPLNPTTLNIILPVGISFYTFQTMSYTIDIYRGQLKPVRSCLQFFAFVSFFPQLVAGPIERARRFLPQFERNHRFNPAQATAGLRLVLWGLFKKIVIADNIALLADEIFAQPEAYPGLGIVLGAVAFAFQIYCDFSAYSDMAIGLGKLLGFELMTNFRKPYFSKSFSEFWQRWHISLSTWFRDYVYIPLGGNRVREGRHAFNLLLTFVLSGLWHGANFTFLIWGFAHGLLLVLEKRLFANRRLPITLVFLLVSLLWIPFRAENITHLHDLLSQLVHFSWPRQLPPVYPPTKALLLLLVFVLFLMAERRSLNINFHQWVGRFSRPLRIGVYSFLLACILLMGNFDVKPYFIYFQF